MKTSRWNEPRKRQVMFIGDIIAESSLEINEAAPGLPSTLASRMQIQEDLRLRL